ncbi:MAG: hypothetical protein ACJ786_17655 [Catenulispora sp.]
MTITLDRSPAIEVSEPRDPAELVSPETFAKLVRYATEHHHVHRFYAAEGVRQALIFLKCVADNPGVRIVPDVSVDPFWHDFLMHTQEYAEFEREHNGGKRLHHVPIMLEDISSGAAMERTIPILRASGYAVDMKWWETGESCCPPNPPVPCNGGD